MRKLAIFAFAFGAAAALSVWVLPTEYLIVAAALAGAGGLLTLLLRTPGGKRCRIAAFGLAFGLVWAWGYDQYFFMPDALPTGQPQTFTGRVLESPSAARKGCTVVLKIKRDRVRLWLDAQPEELEIGDQVKVWAELQPICEDNESALFDQAKGISYAGYQQGELQIRRPESLPLESYPVYWGAKLRQRIREIFPEDVSGFLCALVTGDKNGLSYELSNAMSLTGISHVVAVSGMHISLLMGVVYTLCSRKRRLAAILSIGAMVLFAAVVGFPPSVNRAVTMNALVLLAPLFHREEDIPTSLGLALMLILMVRPTAIASVSLQLSFLATVGIYTLTPQMNQWFLRKTGKARINRCPVLRRVVQGAAVALSASFGAMATTAPVSAAYFGLVSVITPVTNLLAGAVINLAFTLTLPVVALSYLPLLGQAGIWVVTRLIRYVLFVVELLARLPHSAVYTQSSFILPWLGAAYVMLTLFIFRRDRKPRVIAAALVVTLIAGVAVSSGRRAFASVTVLDVGQGQCVLLQCGDQVALVDCGGDRGQRSGEDTVRKLLARGIYQVDYLILTHFDTDHVCGTEQLMSRMNVGGLYVADVGQNSANRANILKAAREENIPVTVLSMDLQMEFGGGILKLFVPLDKKSSNASLSALMSVEEYDILVTGDMDAGDEIRLVKTRSLPDLEVLVAGHHGSKYSTGEVLLKETAPDVVIISVGENSYGHPAQSVLDRITAWGGKVYRTDLDGDITISR